MSDDGDPSRGRFRPSVLLISRNLPPLRGGMERLNAHLARELAKVTSLCIVGPRGAASVGVGHIVAEVPVKPLWRFFLGAALYSLRLAWRQRPRIVLAGSGLCAPFAWLAARFVGAKYVIYVHGLDIVAPHVVYRRLWIPLIRRADLCIANSRNTADLCQRTGVPADRITILHPGVHIPSPMVLDDAWVFRQRHGWTGKHVMLSVGRLTARKGLLEFIVDVLPLIVRRHPNALLSIIGNDAPDALTGQGIALHVEAAIAHAGMHEHVQMLGEVDDATLEAAYVSADVSVFPVRNLPGDVEGFGMVAVEAAAHGLPTVAYAVGGVPDAIAEGQSGYLITEGDVQAFADAVDTVFARGRVSFESSCKAFAAEFEWSMFGQRLRRALELADV